MATCTRPAALTAITQPECEINFDQIVRFLFQRKQAPVIAPDVPLFADESAFKTLASWTPLLAASDDTKVTLSPLFSGMTIPASEGLFEGGNDNTTIDGVELYKGEGFIKVTGQIKGLPAEIAEELRKYTSESAPGITKPLTSFFVNKDGNIIYDKGDAGDKFDGITIGNFRLSSVGSEGYGAKNVHNFSFTLPGNWDKNIAMVKPEFNPRYEL